MKKTVSKQNVTMFKFEKHWSKAYQFFRKEIVHFENGEVRIILLRSSFWLHLLWESVYGTENLFNNAGRNACVSNLLSFGMISIATLMCCVLGSCLASLMVLSLEIMSLPDVTFGDRWAYNEDVNQETCVSWDDGVKQVCFMETLKIYVTHKKNQHLIKK